MSDLGPVVPGVVAAKLAKMVDEVDLINECIRITLASFPKGDPRIEEWGDTPGIMLTLQDMLIQGWEMVSGEDWPVIE